MTRSSTQRATISAFGLVAVVSVLAGAQPSVVRTSRGDSLTRDTVTFTARGGARAGEIVTLRVPERRANPQSSEAATRRVTLRWVHFASMSSRPAAPLIFLAGGPGDAGTRAVATMPVAILDSLRAIGDVIAFDQRATGFSLPILACAPDGQVPLDLPLTVAQRDSIAQAVARRCVSAVSAQGISPAAYTTAESVEDIESVRIALGVPAVSLLGGSYGTHLGLAYLRRYPTHVARVVLAGVEGPDDTFKRPQLVDAMFDSFAQTVAADSVYGAREDLRVVFDRIRQRLDATPTNVTMGGATIAVDAWDLRRFVTSAVGDLRLLQALPSQLHAIDGGNYEALARSAAGLRRARPTNAMNLLMNCASGASPARRAQIEAERATSRLGDVIDFPATAACRLDGLPRLGDDFRAPARSNTAVLFVSGTLDGRTPPANVDALLPYFPNGRHLVIENQSHSLMGDPDVFSATLRFLRGQDVPSARIARARPTFTR